MTRLPNQWDLAVSPELGILAAVRVTLELAADTLRVVHPLDEPPSDREEEAASTVFFLAELLRLAILDYEHLTAVRR